MSQITYETDFAGWAFEQAALLRAGRLDCLDIAHLIEEMEGMGRSEQRALASRFAVLIAHLLKWRFQPNRRSHSWRLTIQEQRRQIQKLLSESPSLKAKFNDEWLADVWQSGVVFAVQETGLDEEVFPAVAIWDIDALLHVDLAQL